MLCTILPVLYMSVTCHTPKWPPHVNRRRAPGVTRLGFNGYGSNPTHSATAPPSPLVINATVTIMTMDIYLVILLIEIVKMLMNYYLHRPTVHTSPSGVYQHLIFTYFRVLQVKQSCRLAVSRAQDEWRTWQVMGMFAWHAPLNTLIGHSRK